MMVKLMGFPEDIPVGVAPEQIHVRLSGNPDINHGPDFFRVALPFSPLISNLALSTNQNLPLHGRAQIAYSFRKRPVI